MKLTKALKLKNRLVGEINQLQQVLQRENSRRNDNPSKVNCQEVYNQLASKRNELINLKSAICRVNAGNIVKDGGIYGKIAMMTEMKSYINFLNTLPKREGEELTLIGSNREKLSYQWTAFINQEKADQYIQVTQAEINTLQDEVICKIICGG